MKTKKVLFSIPERLLFLVDRTSDFVERSRSEFIREALRYYIAEINRGLQPPSVIVF